MTTAQPIVAAGGEKVSFVFLELTPQCPLFCVHCYVESSPRLDHGSMTTEDWLRAIDDAVRLGADTFMLIGGEPTRHPDFVTIAKHALNTGANVFVATGLSEPISDAVWEIFQRPNVRVRTSFYSDDEAEFERITRIRGSYRQVKANIERIVAAGIPLRAAVVHILEGQRTAEARGLLVSMGVSDIVEDRLRQVGRGAGAQPNTMFELCGDCASGLIAVLADGKVAPCVTARWMEVGNVHQQPLAEIAGGNNFSAARNDLRNHFATHGAH